MQQPRIDDVQDGWLLWDVPISARSARLSAQVLDTARHILIACRPDQRISGLARQVLHRGSATFDAQDMTFTEDELHELPAAQANLLLNGYAGWPAFLPLAACPNERVCIDYLRETFLSHLVPGQTSALSIWLEAPSSTSAGDWVGALPPFLTEAPERHPELVRLLTVATRECLATFEAEGAVIEVASALKRAGRSLAAMTLLLDHGHETHAAQILERFQGRELLYRISLPAFQETSPASHRRRSRPTRRFF